MKTWLKLLSYFCALIATSTILEFAPEARDYEQIVGSRETCEVLFIGPSYVRAQIDASEVDAETILLGRPLTTCTFGRPSMSGYEQKWQLERLLSPRWPSLKLVVFDVTLGAKTRIRDGNRWKPRVLHWHDFTQLAWFLARTPADPESSDRDAEFVDHAQHFLANVLQIGQGAFVLHDTGQIPSPSENDRRKKTRQSKRKKRARDEARLRRLLKKKFREGKGAERTGWAIELNEQVSRLGYEGRALVAPVLYPVRVNLRRLAREGTSAFDFNDPNRYPELFVFDVRGRTDHINKKGRKIYSRLLARELVAHLREEER